VACYPVDDFFERLEPLAAAGLQDEGGSCWLDAHERVCTCEGAIDAVLFPLDGTLRSQLAFTAEQHFGSAASHGEAADRGMIRAGSSAMARSVEGPYGVSVWARGGRGGGESRGSEVRLNSIR